MSPVGHTLLGLSLAAFAVPNPVTLRSSIVTGFAFVALTNLPDWPISRWGHDRYDISHSLFVNLSLISVTYLVWARTASLRKHLSPLFVTLATLAWLSHLLLDSFYSHGNGVDLLWPFADGRLNLALPWFDTLDLHNHSVFDDKNLKIFGIELIAYSPVFLLAVFCRWWVERRISSA